MARSRKSKRNAAKARAAAQAAEAAKADAPEQATDADATREANDLADALPVEGRMTTAEQHVRTWCLVLLTGLALVAAMALLKDVLVPFVLAVFFVAALVPLIDLVSRRLEVNHAAAATITVIAGLALAAVIIAVGLAGAQRVLRQPRRLPRPLQRNAHPGWRRTN